MHEPQRVPEARPPDLRRMVVRRIPPTLVHHGPLAGFESTIWTQNGIPVCELEDENGPLRGTLFDGDSTVDADIGQLEPLPDRMVATHWLKGSKSGPTPGFALWIGVGDGWAIPLPAEAGLVHLPMLLTWVAQGGGDFTTALNVRDAIAEEFGGKR